MENEVQNNGQTILIEPEAKLEPAKLDDLPVEIADAARAMGWPSLMPVQGTAIPYLLADRDMIVQSRTGSGKTGAFLIPLMMKIDPSLRATQALVLVPTRELASQVYQAFESLSANLGLHGALVYGGVGYGAQLQALRDGAHVIIGTPGRVLDHLGRRSMSLDQLKVMVFDEADEMLSMGFYPAMRELRRYLPRHRRSWMFSATMPYKVQSLAEEFLTKPEFLSLSAGNEAVSTAEHRYYIVPAMEKDIVLMRLIEIENPESAIIFCNTKIDVEFVASALQNHGYNADQLSGDLDQKARELAMARIRRRETRFLVATDVAARGIDISDLAYVFQYDVPKDPEPYLHRAGRTARAGNTGVVVTFVGDMSERSSLRKIARKYSFEFVEMPMPTEQDVEERIFERTVVLLEDRFRAKTSRAQKLRIKRFERLVQTLAETEDERGILAMMLDDLYHETFHAARQAAQVATDIETKEREPEPKKAKSGGKSDAKKSKEPRHESPRHEAPRQETPSRIETADVEAPELDAEAPGENGGGDAAGDEAKKKKKRRRGKRGSGKTREPEESGAGGSGESDAWTGNAEAAASAFLVCDEPVQSR
jgi:ATP-dependent RNA helicase DeaD